MNFFTIRVAYFSYLKKFGELNHSDMQKVYFVWDSKFCSKNVRTMYLETLSKSKVMSINIRVFWYGNNNIGIHFNLIFSITKQNFDKLSLKL